MISALAYLVGAAIGFPFGWYLRGVWSCRQRRKRLEAYAAEGFRPFTTYEQIRAAEARAASDILGGKCDVRLRVPSKSHRIEFPPEFAPTEEGRRRFPPNGIYAEAREVCTCEPGCSVPCKGECGCKACTAAYGDFLSVE